MSILLINILLKKLINHLPAEKKNIKIHGLSTNSKKIQKGFIFLPLMEENLMEKDLLMRRF